MVFVPIYDDNHLKFIPFQRTTWLLILLNVAVFIWQMTLGEAALENFDIGAGVVPASFLGQVKLPPEIELTSPVFTLITYMFLHGDIWHLLGNMAFLWVFGDNVEDAMGSIRFFFFFLLCGIAAALAHTAMNTGSEAPLIGASGAMAGVIAAYLMLYPRVKVWVLLFARIPLRLSAWIVLASWIVVQVVFLLTDLTTGTALWAHIGGFVAGAALIPIFKRPEQPLFASNRPQ